MKRYPAYVDVFWKGDFCTIVKSDARHNELSRNTVLRRRATESIRSYKAKHIPVFEHGPVTISPWHPERDLRCR